MDLIKEINILMNHFFGAISHTTLWGLPLDTTLHVIVGFIITFIGLRLKFSFIKVFLFLLFIESLKAWYDSYTLNHEVLHAVKEFTATFVYPILVCCVRIIKSFKDRNFTKEL